MVQQSFTSQLHVLIPSSHSRPNPSTEKKSIKTNTKHPKTHSFGLVFRTFGQSGRRVARVGQRFYYNTLYYTRIFARKNYLSCRKSQTALGLFGTTEGRLSAGA